MNELVSLLNKTSFKEPRKNPHRKSRELADLIRKEMLERRKMFLERRTKRQHLKQDTDEMLTLFSNISFSNEGKKIKSNKSKFKF